MTPTLEGIRRAAHRIAGRVRRTPIVHSEWLSEASGGTVHLKLETLQVTGSFKARGALNAVLALGEVMSRGDRPTLVTASAGNHGRALAWAASTVGYRTVVFTPRNAPSAKLDAIRRLGADLRAEADTYEHSEELAKAFAAATGCPFISAYSHPDLIAATGTITLEVLEDRPTVNQIVVPVGGGGLLAGTAAAAHATRPDLQVVGVEADASPAFTCSLAAGRIVDVQVGPTVADGLAGNMDHENLAFPIVRDLVRTMTTVSEAALGEAIRGLVLHDHLVTEGAGAAGAAAVAAGRVSCSGRDTVIVLSGANIDLPVLASLLGAAQG